MTTNVASQHRLPALTLCALVAMCVLCAEPLAAQDEPLASPDDAWGESDDEQGFGEATPDDGEVVESSPEADHDQPSPFSLRGFHRLVLGAWVERLSEQPLASARNEIELAASYEHEFQLGEQSTGRFRAHAGGRVYYDAAYLLNRELYDEPTLELYELGHLPREIYAALALGPFRIATGRQLVGWGEGEVLSLLDRVNPLDLREPGLTPTDERRLPVALTHADLELGRHRIELIAVHEVSFGLLPPPLSAMSPLRALLLDVPGLEDKTLRYHHEPEPSLFLAPAHQWHGRYTFRAPFADFALHASSMLDPFGVPVLPAPAELANGAIDFAVYHPRFELLGASIVAPVDDFLLRAEAQWSFERPIALRRLDSPQLDLTSERVDQLDVLLGATLVVSAATSFGLEALQSYLPDRLPSDGERLSTLWPVEATQIALRADHALLRDRLPLQLVALLIGLDPVNAWVVRAQFGYLVSESFKVQLQLIHYEPTDHFGLFYGFERHDRVVLGTQWDWML